MNTWDAQRQTKQWNVYFFQIDLRVDKCTDLYLDLVASCLMTHTPLRAIRSGNRTCTTHGSLSPTFCPFNLGFVWHQAWNGGRSMACPRLNMDCVSCVIGRKWNTHTNGSDWWEPVEIGDPLIYRDKCLWHLRHVTLWTFHKFHSLPWACWRVFVWNRDSTWCIWPSLFIYLQNFGMQITGIPKFCYRLNSQ